MDITNYQLSSYALQQFISQILYTTFYFNNPLFFLCILISGLISGLSPCLVSMLPILLTYSMIHKSYWKNAFIFMSGLLSVEIILGCIICIIGYRCYILLVALPVFSSILSIFIGILTLQIVYINNGVFLFRLQSYLFSKEVLKYFIVGGLLAINTLPCNLPIFLTIFSTLLNANNFIVLLFYSLVYFLGYLVPILFLSFLFSKVRSLKYFLVFAINRIYLSLGGFCILTSGIFRFLKIFFYNLY